ncbi:MAG: serine/threonine-protein kinase, partial [Nakamurella sp.]
MPSMSLRPGEVFAGYTVERELGSGGMGSVYLVRHPRLPRHDALKLLRAELCSDPGFVGRFEREADTVAQLDHPNIVSVHDRGSQDGQLWISMRFIDGTNAQEALAHYEHGMPPDRVVRIVSKVASALDYAHRHGLLHRDVKPANILLTDAGGDEESERVFLSDFGVAKAIGEAAEQISSLTSTGSVVATLDYASPEQIKGQVLDHRSDIYALGCVLYKLLTGIVPFPGESVAARVYGHLNSEIPEPSALVPSLPTGFDEVVARAMAKVPDERYPSCRQLASAATAALSSPVAAIARPAPPVAELATTVTAPEPSTPHRLRQSSRAPSDPSFPFASSPPDQPSAPLGGA